MTNKSVLDSRLTTVSSFNNYAMDAWIVSAHLRPFTIII